MIAIIDYGMGNLRSVENALHRLGAEYELTADPVRLQQADRVLLPGVGHAAEAMARLQQARLTELIPNLRRPVLGICVGLQVLCRHSAEGDCDCLGVFDTFVRRFPDSDEAKVPHMGWNSVGNLDGKSFRAHFYKCGDKLQQPHFLSWNAIGNPKPNFHLPQFFGTIVFER